MRPAGQDDGRGALLERSRLEDIIFGCHRRLEVIFPVVLGARVRNASGASRGGRCVEVVVRLRLSRAAQG